MSVQEIKVWNASRGTISVGVQKKLVRPGQSAWVMPDEAVLRHIGSGALVKIDEKQPEPAPKKKKADTAPAQEDVPTPEVVEESAVPETPQIEDSILDGDAE